VTRLFLTLAFVLLLVPGAARAACGDGTGERGVALLIGVSNYRAPAAAPESGAWGQLDNALRDVDEVCAKLSKAGFATRILRDPTFEQLDSAIFDFHDAAQESDLAVVYFAGHGFEFRGQSYIVPVDAPKRTSLGAMTGDFLPMSRLLNAASASKQFGLFLLDACRTRDPVVQVIDAAPTEPGNTPGSVGLVSVPDGAVIFSTVVGRPALDAAPADSVLSPFASAIVAGLDLPGLELTDFYAFVHEDVVRRTGAMAPVGPQYPALYKITPSKLYLVEPPEPSRLPVFGALVGMEVPIQLPPPERLAVEDEPKLIREVLSKYKFGQLLRAAERDNPVAQYLAGYAYEFGIGVDADLAKAKEWLALSAAQGHPGGLLELAYFLEHNEGGGNGQARELYEKAAATGYAKAQSHLAALLWSDALARPEAERAELRQRALGLFEQAAAAGHVYATYALATNSPERRPTAEARLREIAAAGNPQGSYWLCELAAWEGKAATAAKECELAAYEGFGVARAILAGMYARGDGVAQSNERAQYWARLALTEPELAAQPGLYQTTQGLAE